MERKIEWQMIVYQAQKQNTNPIWDVGREKGKPQKAPWTSILCTDSLKREENYRNEEYEEGHALERK